MSIIWSPSATFSASASLSASSTRRSNGASSISSSAGISLSKSDIIGIAIGCAVAVLLLLIFYVCFCHRKGGGRSDLLLMNVDDPRDQLEEQKQKQRQQKLKKIIDGSSFSRSLPLETRRQIEEDRWQAMTGTHIDGQQHQRLPPPMPPPSSYSRLKITAPVDDDEFVPETAMPVQQQHSSTPRSRASGRSLSLVNLNQQQLQQQQQQLQQDLDIDPILYRPSPSRPTSIKSTTSNIQQENVQGLPIGWSTAMSSRYAGALYYVSPDGVSHWNPPLPPNHQGEGEGRGDGRGDDDLRPNPFSGASGRGRGREDDHNDDVRPYLTPERGRGDDRNDDDVRPRLSSNSALPTSSSSPFGTPSKSSRGITTISPIIATVTADEVVRVNAFLRQQEAAAQLYL
jgi:hypothetical protein